MVRQATFRVEGLPKTLNAWSRAHWTLRAGLAEETRWRVRLATQRALQVGQWDGNPFPQARVTVTFGWPNRRRRDLDNAVPKLLLDGLVAAGVLPDDSADRVVALTLQSGPVVGGPGWTELVVEEVDQDGPDGATG
jgi:Holliday junction resolvase RusA-like endonuclease